MKGLSKGIYDETFAGEDANRIDSFTFVQGKTINEMVQTNPHQLNTHVQRLPLSASVVIIIITRLLATSRIIP